MARMGNRWRSDLVYGSGPEFRRIASAHRWTCRVLFDRTGSNDDLGMLGRFYLAGIRRRALALQVAACLDVCVFHLRADCGCPCATFLR